MSSAHNAAAACAGTSSPRVAVVCMPVDEAAAHDARVRAHEARLRALQQSEAAVLTRLCYVTQTLLHHMHDAIADDDGDDEKVEKAAMVTCDAARAATTTTASTQMTTTTVDVHLPASRDATNNDDDASSLRWQCVRVPSAGMSDDVQQLYACLRQLQTRQRQRQRQLGCVCAASSSPPLPTAAGDTAADAHATHDRSPCRDDVQNSSNSNSRSNIQHVDTMPDMCTTHVPSRRRARHLSCSDAAADAASDTHAQSATARDILARIQPLQPVLADTTRATTASVQTPAMTTAHDARLRAHVLRRHDCRHRRRAHGAADGTTAATCAVSSACAHGSAHHTHSDDDDDDDDACSDGQPARSCGVVRTRAMRDADYAMLAEQPRTRHGNEDTAAVAVVKRHEHAQAQHDHVTAASLAVSCTPAAYWDIGFPASSRPRSRRA